MPLFPAISRVLTAQHRWQRLKFAVRVCFRDPTLHPLDYSPPFDADLCARMFLRNQTLLHTVAASNGSRALTYLQPFNGIGVRVLSPLDRHGIAHLQRRVTVDGTTELEAMEAVYARLTAEFERWQDATFIDLTTIFDRTHRDIYIDQVHCSDVGYDLMARRIARDVLTQEGLDRSLDGPG